MSENELMLICAARGIEAGAMKWIGAYPVKIQGIGLQPNGVPKISFYYTDIDRSVFDESYYWHTTNIDDIRDQRLTGYVGTPFIIERGNR